MTHMLSSLANGRVILALEVKKQKHAVFCLTQYSELRKDDSFFSIFKNLEKALYACKQ